MVKGKFKCIFRNKVNPRDIEFCPGSGEIPDDQLELRDQVDNVLHVLRIIFPNDDNTIFEYYFQPLLSLAQTGLVGDNAQPKLSMRALTSLKNEIVAREAGRVKNKYMKNLGKKAILLGLPPLIVILFLRWLVPVFVFLFIKCITPQFQLLQIFLVLWSGCMAGVWLSFGVRKIRFRFEDLAILEEDRLEPMIHLIFAGIITIIFGLLFSTEAITVKLGTFTTANFTENFQIALLIGMIFGFCETALPSVLTAQASSFFKFQK